MAVNTEPQALTEVLIERNKRQASSSPSELQRSISSNDNLHTCESANVVWGSKPPSTPNRIQQAKDVHSPMYTPNKTVMITDLDRNASISSKSHTSIATHARKTLSSKFDTNAVADTKIRLIAGID